MFNLVLSVISAVLIGLFTLAAVYYMSPATDFQQRVARAGRAMNESAQIYGAVKIFEMERPGEQIASFSDLVPNYLSAMPAGEWSMASGGFVKPALERDVCEIFNQKMGYGAIAPSCDDESRKDQIVCCTR